MLDQRRNLALQPGAVEELIWKLCGDRRVVPVKVVFNAAMWWLQASVVVVLWHLAIAGHDPFSPIGIELQTARFLDVFLLHCLLSDSPRCTKDEYFETDANLADVVNQGRREGLQLTRQGEQIGMQDWARQLLEQIRHSAALLDQTHATELYSDSIVAQAQKIDNPALTPSARVLAALEAEKQPFYAFGL